MTVDMVVCAVRVPLTPLPTYEEAVVSDPRPLVYSEMCETCIFRPGNQMHLKQGRLKGVVDGNLEVGALLMCHKTTFGQKKEEVACRGFYDRYGDRVNVKRVMDRLGRMMGYSGGFREVDPDEPEA